MKTQKGITLIALIITIIVMLILVGVSVSVALNTGLFKAAQGAAKNTEAERINETKLSEGQVTIGNTTYSSIQEYTNVISGKTIFKHTDEDGDGELDFGELVTHIATGEQFYVLGTEGETVELIAKYNLKVEGDTITTVQDTTRQNDNHAFSSDDYWVDESVEVDLNDITQVPAGVSAYALSAVKSYAESLGLKADEARLADFGDDVFYGSQLIEKIYGEQDSFWIAEYDATNGNVWRAFGNYTEDYCYASEDNTVSFDSKVQTGVRAVLNVTTEKIGV